MGLFLTSQFTEEFMVAEEMCSQYSFMMLPSVTRLSFLNEYFSESLGAIQ